MSKSTYTRVYQYAESVQKPTVTPSFLYFDDKVSESLKIAKMSFSNPSLLMVEFLTKSYF